MLIGPCAEAIGQRNVVPGGFVSHRAVCVCVCFYFFAGASDGRDRHNNWQCTKGFREPWDTLFFMVPAVCFSLKIGWASQGNQPVLNRIYESNELGLDSGFSKQLGLKCRDGDGVSFELSNVCFGGPCHC